MPTAMVEEAADVRAAQPTPLSERGSRIRARNQAIEDFMSSERLKQLLEFSDEVRNANSLVVRDLNESLAKVADHAEAEKIKEARLIGERLDHLSEFITKFALREIELQKNWGDSSSDPKIDVYTAEIPLGEEERDYWVKLEIQPESGTGRHDVVPGRFEETLPGCEFRLIPKKDSETAAAIRLDSISQEVFYVVEVKESGRQLLLPLFGKERAIVQPTKKIEVDNKQFTEMMRALNLWVKIKTPQSEA